MPNRGKGNLVPVIRQFYSKKGKPYLKRIWISQEEKEQLTQKIKNTADKYQKNGVYVKERVKLHTKIKSEIVNSCPKPAKGEKPTCILLLGGAASGKSTVVNKFLKPKYGDKFGTLNSDDIKDKIPEFKEFRNKNVEKAASGVHRESSDIAKSTFNTIINDKRNFIYDGVLGDSNKANNIIDVLKKKGYNIKLVGVNVDVDEALGRMESRAFGRQEKFGVSFGSGRFVPKKTLIEGHKGSVSTFEKIKGKVDSIELYDNNVPMGADPKKVIEDGKVLNKRLYNKFLQKKNYKEMLKSILEGFLSLGRDMFSQKIPLEDEQGNKLYNDLEIQKAIIDALSSKLSQLHDRYEMYSNDMDEDLDNLNKALSKGKFNEGVADNRKYIVKRYTEAIDDVLSDIMITKQEIIKAEKNYKQLLGEVGDFKYKKYMSKSLGRKRETMPQIDKEDLDSYLMHFSDKAKAKKIKVKASSLKPAQKDINEDKVMKMLFSKKLKGGDSYIISKDMYLMDGTHRWARQLEVDEDKEVTCYKINVKAKELLRRSNIMKITKNKDINDIKKAIETMEIAFNDGKISEEKFAEVLEIKNFLHEENLY